MTELTSETPFREIPVQQIPLLTVNSGVNIAAARCEAEDMEHAVRQVLMLGIETGINGSVSFLCEFALEVASALRQSCNSR
jgi:hypothetical protein